MIVYTHLFLMTLSLILSCFFVISSLQEVSPVQTNVGSDANFSFMLTEDPNTAFVNIQNKSDGIVLSARGNKSASNNPFYKDRVNFTGNTYQKLISFILRNVTLVDAGIYNAVLTKENGAIVTIGSQMLIVKAAPSEPQIVELEGHAVNGTNYHLNCSAQSNSQPPNHNLSMFSEWRKDDMLISSGRYIVSGTELTINGVSYKEDNGSTLTCVAFEDQLSKSGNSDKFIMDVKYGPGNSVNLGSIPPTLGLDLHQTAPDITCNATCNPPCDYRWYQNGTFLRNGAILSLGVVEKTTRGNYRCEAYTSVLGVNRSSSTSVNITVYYAPEVLLQPALLPRPSVYILKLGQTNIGLRCLVIDANPPVQRFIWTKDGHEIQTQTSSTFTITMVSKDNMGRWGCKGVNSKGNPLESTLDVDVHYGPIITNMPSMIEEEGDPINVSCIVDSRPDPSSITWTKSQNNTFTQNKADMYISHLNRADKGTYECTAVNTIQPSGVTVGEIITVKSNYTLDVTFGAGIVNLSVNNNTVSENSSATFQCHVDSNPPSTITWMKESNNAVLQTESGVVQSQYRIESAECLNMDNYTCSAYNGIRTPAKATMPLFVRCHPRTDSRFSHETKIYKRRYEAAVLRYTVISYPLPTFNWTFLGNGSESRYLNFSHNNGLQSELWFSSLGIDDFGNYSVIADNSLFPSAREVFEIIPADVPEVPSSVTIVEITQTSMKVHWTAGNNGGLKQIFHVVVTAGSLVRNVTADDPGYRENGTVVIDGLLPKTKYSIYMIASNLFGSSDMTETINITTLEVITTDSSSTFSLAAVAGGLGAGVVVILMAVVALFLWRRYHHRSQHSDGSVLHAWYVHIQSQLADQSNYEKWVENNASDKRTTKCRACSNIIDIANMGEAALQSHSSSKKHVQNCKIRKSAQNSTISGFISNSASPSPKVMAKPATTLTSYTSSNDVLKAEIFWTLRTVNTHSSFHSNEGISRFFSLMFPVSAICTQIHLR